MSKTSRLKRKKQDFTTTVFDGESWVKLSFRNRGGFNRAYDKGVKLLGRELHIGDYIKIVDDSGTVVDMSTERGTKQLNEI